MKFYYSILLLVSTLLLIQGDALATEDKDISPALNVSQEGELLLIQPIVSSSSDTLFNYHLKVERKGDSGISSTTQSGDVHAKAGEKIKFGHVSVSFQDGSECVIELSVYHKGKLISTVTSRYPE